MFFAWASWCVHGCVHSWMRTCMGCVFVTIFVKSWINRFSNWILVKPPSQQNRSITIFRQSIFKLATTQRFCKKYFKGSSLSKFDCREPLDIKSLCISHPKLIAEVDFSFLIWLSNNCNSAVEYTAWDQEALASYPTRCRTFVSLLLAFFLNNSLEGP